MGRRKKYEEALIIVLVVVILMIGAAQGSLTVEASPKTLNRSGDTVTLTLTWTANSSSSSDMDWLGIYNPPDSADEHFIGYILLSSFCPNWMKEEGSCYVDLPLINLRRSYEFRVFRWDKSEISKRTPLDEDHNPLPSTAHPLATSEVVTFLNFNDPAQLHLAYTSNQDEMLVMFLTRDDIKSYARYGLDEELHSVAEARSVTYTRSKMCDEPANTSLGWRDPGHIHDAVMQGLEPGKRYFYQNILKLKGNWNKREIFPPPI